MGDAEAPIGAPWLAVSEDDYLWYVDLALDEMVAIVSGLGDGTANRRPDLAGAKLAVRHPHPLPRRPGVLGRVDGGGTGHHP